MEALPNTSQASIANPEPDTAGSESRLSAPPPKRIQLTTSRTRRVKCDEQKPLCRRCVQAGRLCGGYKDESKVPVALKPALRIGVAADSGTERLTYLATHVLCLDNNGRPVQEDGAWGRIFLQLSNQVACVKAAAAAFGAAYESLLDNAIERNPCSAWRYYGSALTKLQSDINNGTAGPESLALASMVLACTEILSQHETNAFAHFLGAVQILTQSQHGCQGAPRSSAHILSTVKDELVKFDVLIGSYAISQTPAFMYLESNWQGAAPGDDVFHEPELAINSAMLCLHRSYRFVESAAKLRYTYPSWKDHDPVMCEGQSDAVAQCRSVLNGLGALATRLQAQYSSAISTLRDSETLAEIYALRTQLTAAIIYILCTHSPLQTTYDEHQLLFQSIVSDAAASARLRRRAQARRPSSASQHAPALFSSLLHRQHEVQEIPPLRCPGQRTLLNEQSREGPTDGHIMAAIGARLAAIETAGTVPSPRGAPQAACNVPEDRRVHGYGVSPPKLNGEGHRVVEIEFSRPKVPLVQGWGDVDYTDLGSWVFWSETVNI
ncbi:predicted protein [Chaetomium globosum CBS 148.51]|uniref:Zn(2)-C6 fungal-type domain-containing protein n=1 Tax=Chaetomium globosum (strain ATCC 6205 / CBS 148.51 / DSM 1962 / NBRC 6347 / NRRL 1970) TaxID=306901 RepID=Q2HCM0_CHAGB|nr:uncharacterized protein CHGG_02034 [Chaetomium globosum CBS 148.51]EAQ93799.1 predicted protein [Chaetomium globosum CBS 148.51]